MVRRTDETVQDEGRGEPAGLTRRTALARLGLASAVAYTVPTLVRIDRSANAQILPSPCRPPGQVGSPSGGPSPGNPVHCPPGHSSPGGGPPGHGGGGPPGQGGGGPPGQGG
ncbi:MAG: hypothetical protein WD341_00330 [Tistlia sp.]|uniref:hypothetical protein n=1 Tax=Tistlia sp. TaxID=3057121 RepID=UPI0034A29931